MQKGIAQGNPLSPVISNIVGWHFVDAPLKQRFLNFHPELFYARYSDNLFLVAPKQGNYNRYDLSNELGTFLSGSITDSLSFKFDVRSNRQENIVLGIRVGVKPQLKNKKWLRSVFYRVHTRGSAMLKDKDILQDFGRMSYPKLLEVVQGLAAFAVSIDSKMKDYIDRNKPMEIINAKN
jgi:hypothetical protein